MTDQETRLRELLAYHGADVSQWPKEVKTLGFLALRRPNLAAIIEEEKRFEMQLHRRNEPAVPQDLAQRIIAASRMQPSSHQSAVGELLAEVRPAALAAMMVLGFAIGFEMLPPLSHGRDIAAQASFDDEGAIL